ncbi:hypothetical protein [Eikenella halliae]|uniref:hypothetical protein n=1 Tax=Eikenella halliae TaxID=1795832 RepID=UPI0028D4EB74|nr:hypothetical protein [Eikenella halliae]
MQKWQAKRSRQNRLPENPTASFQVARRADINAEQNKQRPSETAAPSRERRLPETHPPSPAGEGSRPQGLHKPRELPETLKATRSTQDGLPENPTAKFQVARSKISKSRLD